MKIIFIVTIFLGFNLSVLGKTISILQYNAENFFDTQHDDGTLDFTFLPQNIKKILPQHRNFCFSLTSEFYRKECLNLDWTEEKFRKKIQQISRVVRSFDATEKGADFLILQEVENIQVLNKLIALGLSDCGYQETVLIEGNDSRGIDVAILSKFPLVKKIHHPLVINGEVIDTRGILEAHFKVEDHLVVIFNNHWPSQNHPTHHRIQSAQMIETLAQKTSADLILAVGDFNSIDSESPHPFSFMPSFVDAEKEARILQPNLWPGTHYFRGKWSSLDKIFIHRSSSLDPLYENFQIMAHPFLMRVSSTTGKPYPYRFNHSKAEGFSDHLPVTMSFKK